MKKLLLFALILLVVFAGSAVASPSNDVNEREVTKLTNGYIAINENPQQREINADGYTCWQCTSYTYVNGYKVCTSGVWRTTCPVNG